MIGSITSATPATPVASVHAGNQFTKAFDPSIGAHVGWLSCANIAINPLNRGTRTDGP